MAEVIGLVHQLKFFTHVYPMGQHLIAVSDIGSGFARHVSPQALKFVLVGICHESPIGASIQIKNRSSCQSKWWMRK